MIRLVRALSLPRLGARREFYGLRQPGFRAYVMRLEGMTYDARALGSSNTRNSFANDLTLVLRGTWHDGRDGGHLVQAGLASGGPSLPNLDERWEDHQELLTLEWDTPPLQSFFIRPLSEDALRAARRFATAVTAETSREDDQPALADLLDQLRRDGFPAPVVTPLAPPIEAVRAAHMLNHALAHLHDAPMWVDFTSQRSERQWRRDLVRAGPWLGLLNGTFRGTLNTLRLLYAATFLNAPGVRLREVAERLGYSSDRALLQAMKRAGMSPDAVRRLADASTAVRKEDSSNRPA